MIKRYPRHFVNIAPGTWKILFDLIKPQANNGADIERFEKSFAKYIGAPHAIAVSSGRVALFLALKGLGLEEKDEVILSAYNFPIVPLMIKKCGLVAVFVDADIETYNIDIDSIRRHITHRTRAIIATHLFGQPCDIERLKEIAVEKNIRLIEDCAHSCGAEYKGQKVGSFGDTACFSFSMPKNITCFGGGMVTVKKAEIADNIRKCLSSFSSVTKSELIKSVLTAYIIYFLLSPHIFPFFSYPILRILDLFNFDLTKKVSDKELEIFYAQDPRRGVAKLNNIQARIGLLQLGRIEEVNNRLRKNASLISTQLGRIDGVHLPRSITSSKGIFSYYRILVDEPDRLKRLLLRKGIDSQRGNIIDCSRLKFFIPGQKDRCPNTEMLSNRGLEIPSNHLMRDADLLIICNILKQLVGEI